MSRDRIAEVQAKYAAGQGPTSEQIAQAVASSLDRVLEARKRIKARVDQVVNADREAVRQHEAVNDIDWTRSQLDALGK